MTSTHPFTEIESRLMRPHADGVLLTVVKPGSALAEAGVTAGDVVVGIDDVDDAPTRMGFLQACQKTPDGPDERTLQIVSPDGTHRLVEVTLPLQGVSPCEVRAGVPAWTDEPDVGECDFSAFDRDVDIFLRNSLEETRAGHEVLRIRRRPGEGLIDVEVVFRLGGDDGQGGTWDYHTRGRATLRLAPGLPAVATSFTEMGRLVGDVRLEDGMWRGERDGPDGTRVPVENPANADVCTAYVLTIVPLTMALEEGARLTFCSTGDGVGTAGSRQRFTCAGKETVQVDGEDVEAWCFVQRHWGLDSYGGDERMYVTDDRRLVRVDWGPNYAGCWGEAVPLDRLDEGVPEHVRFAG